MLPLHPCSLFSAWHQFSCCSSTESKDWGATALSLTSAWTEMHDHESGCFLIGHMITVEIHVTSRGHFWGRVCLVLKGIFLDPFTAVYCCRAVSEDAKMTLASSLQTLSLERELNSVSRCVRLWIQLTPEYPFKVKLLRQVWCVRKLSCFIRQSLLWWWYSSRSFENSLRISLYFLQESWLISSTCCSLGPFSISPVQSWHSTPDVPRACMC